MSQIQIKRSILTSTPTSLEKGELAWSDASGKLFIGDAATGAVTTVVNTVAIATALTDIATAQSDIISLSSALTATNSTLTTATGNITTLQSGLSTLAATVAGFTFVTASTGLSDSADLVRYTTGTSNLVIAGNLTVNGTTTTVNSTTVSTGDAILQLANGATSVAATEAGLEVVRPANNAFLIWNEATAQWGYKIGSGSFTAFAAASGSVAWSAITATPTTLAGYGITDAYTSTETDTAISTAISTLNISNYALTSAVTSDIATAVTGLASESWVTTQIAAAAPDLSGYALTTAVTSAIASEATARDSAIATAVTGLASTSYVDSAVAGEATARDTAITTAVTGLATVTYVDTQDAATLVSANSYTDSAIAAFIIDGGTF